MNPFRWRLMTWPIILWTGLMLVWAANAAGGTGDALAGGIAATVVFSIWFVGFIIPSIIWFMTRPQRRIYRACGHEGRKGQTTCKRCGYNFASPTLSVASPAVAHPAPTIPAVSGSEIKAAVARVHRVRHGVSATCPFL